MTYRIFTKNFVSTFVFLSIFVCGFNAIETAAQKKSSKYTGVLSGAISGTVFNDVSGNGKLDASESGVANVTVLAYDVAEVLRGSTVTQANGSYNLNADGSGPYRIEFVNFPAGFTTGKHSTASGFNSQRTPADSGTSIQFVLDGNTSNVNLALFNPSTIGAVSPIASDDILQNGFAVYSKVSYGSEESTLVVRDITQLGTLIDDPTNRVPNDMSSNAPIVRQWTAGEFENHSIYAVAVDRFEGTIYAAVSPYYSWDRTPKIFKINGKTGAVTLLATLPNNVTLPHSSENKGFGIGAIEFDSNHKQLFAANMDDGKIYRLDAVSGTVLSVLDPRNPDNSGVNVPPVNELVTAIGYNRKENRLYYSMWDHDNANHISSTLYSMNLDAAGDFKSSTNRPEFSVPAKIYAPEESVDPIFYPRFPPVTDIEFNDADNRVLICENSISYDANYNPVHTFVFAAHNSSLMEYAGNSGSWTLDPTVYTPGGNMKYEVGEFSYSDSVYGNNTRGGAAWAYKSIVNGNVAGNEEYVVATADTIVYQTDNFMYGMTFMPSSGGSDRYYTPLGANSVGIDLDDNILEPDKWIYGDLDIRRWTAPPLEIGNRIWSDANDDGVQNANEYGISGVTVNLYRPGFGPDGIAGNGDDNEPVASTLTNTSGEYYFSTIFTNTGYEIRLDNPADYAAGGILEGKTLIPADAGSDSVDSDASNVANPNGSPAGIFPVIFATTPSDTGTGNPSFDFGFSGTGVSNFSIGNRVWFDTNNNGLIDAVEVGVNNVSVSLFADANADGTPDNLNNPLSTVTTNSQGFYMFGSLAEGNYVVRVNPSNFQTGGRLFKYKNSSVTETDPNLDVDSNDNGLDNAAMPATGVLSGTIALGAGFVEPTGESEPAFYGNGSCSGNLSQDNLSNATIDFGFNMLSLSGMVFYDPYNTAQLTPYGIGQILVKLYAADGVTVIAETLTNERGEYRFDNLDEGTYTVRVAPSLFGMTVGLNSPNGGNNPDPVIDPDNNTAGDDNGINGTGDFLGYLVSQPVTLSFGDEPTLDNANGATLNPTVDFGLTPGFSIGNRVWFDTNNNGLIDASEIGVNNVSVSLFSDVNADGIPDSSTPIAVLRTDAGGYYRFDQLYPGNYLVRVDASNFQSGGALFNTANSSGVSGGNSDTDLADHGVEGSYLPTTGIFSQTVTLNYSDQQFPPQAGEPSGETQPNSYGANSTNGVAGYDTAENLTIDFGFYSFAPTAASVDLKGRVITSGGRGILNAQIKVVGGDLTAPVSTRTNSFGYFTVPNLSVNKIYFINVNAKQYEFDPSTQVINLIEESDDVIFRAN